MIALLPGITIYLYSTGWGGALNIVLCVTGCLLFESIALQMRAKPIFTTVNDYSAMVSGLLLALCLPPLLPYWVPLTGCFFTIIVAKHLYGGLGQNIFNPAMVGYAAILVAFPRDFSLWPIMPEAFTTNLTTTVQIIFSGGLVQHSSTLNAAQIDGLTGATILDASRSVVISRTYLEPTIGPFAISTIQNLAYLVGGLWLLLQRIISWHIPAALLASLAFCNTLWPLINHSGIPIDTTVHLLSGATMIGAFFIATDPVTAAASNSGKLIYAASIGLLIWMIRTFGGYPDSIAFAVLILNCAVPAIDYWNPTLTRRSGR